MKKIIAYTEDQVKQIIGLLNCVTVTGVQNSKQIAAVAQILDSGTPGEIKEPEQEKEFKKQYTPVDWKTVSSGVVPPIERCKEKGGEG